jgi:hypothetical protein
MSPAHTFVSLSFLTDAGIQNTNAPAKDIHERCGGCAALAWARASIASATDPDSWPILV